MDLSGPIPEKEIRYAAHPQDNKGRDALNVEGLRDFILLFCFNLEREQFWVLF
jgi:hypothetical protein